MISRCAGVLLAVFSLPGGWGIGDFGPSARGFVNRLHAAGQRLWQVLPLSPTEAGFAHSPYHSLSCHALNPLLVSLEDLRSDGLLRPGELAAARPPTTGTVDYAYAERLKRRLLNLACARFRSAGSLGDYETFCQENAFWLDDYSLFRALGQHFGRRSWTLWPEEFRDRRRTALSRFADRRRAEIENIRIEQYLLFRQWRRLRDFSRERGVALFGDLPIYVPLESADVWADPGLFRLDRSRRPLAVSGVPPDCFSRDGQLWGHPLYDWEAHRRTGFSWWVRRLCRQLNLFDAVRLDHFRGLVAYWEVPAGARTARRGRWVEAPAEAFFAELQRRFLTLPLVAEDLGHITADVRETLRRIGLPGMRVLLFGFSGDVASNPNAVHNVPPEAVVYTGTHDNNTVRGWFEGEATAEEKDRLFKIVGRQVPSRRIAWELVRLAYWSPARWVIIPLQDLLGLGREARLNTPGRRKGNWRWRLTPRQLQRLPVARLREWATLSGRA